MHKLISKKYHKWPGLTRWPCFYSVPHFYFFLPSFVILISLKEPSLPSHPSTEQSLKKLQSEEDFSLGITSRHCHNPSPHHLYLPRWTDCGWVSGDTWMPNALQHAWCIVEPWALGISWKRVRITVKYIPFQELQLIHFTHNALGSQSSGSLGNLLKDQSVFVMKAKSTEHPKTVWGI